MKQIFLIICAILVTTWSKAQAQTLLPVQRSNFTNKIDQLNMAIDRKSSEEQNTAYDALLRMMQDQITYLETNIPIQEKQYNHDKEVLDAALMQAEKSHSPLPDKAARENKLSLKNIDIKRMKDNLKKDQQYDEDIKKITKGMIAAARIRLVHLLNDFAATLE